MAGVYMGTRPKYDRREARRLRSEERLTAPEIAERMGYSVKVVYRLTGGMWGPPPVTMDNVRQLRRA